MSAITLFEEKHLRRAWNQAEEKWYFAIVDVIAILTESDNPQLYWRVMRKPLSDEGNETVTNCNALKMTAADGNQRLSDVANDEALLRLIQTIPSPKAEPLRITRKQAVQLPTQFPLKLGIIKRTNRSPAREQLMKLPSREASEFHRLADRQQRTLIHHQCEFGGESLLQRIQTTLTRKRVHFSVGDFQGHIHDQSLAATWMGGKFQWEVCKDAATIQTSNQLQRGRTCVSAETPPTQVLHLTKFGEKLVNHLVFEANAISDHLVDQWAGTRNDTETFGNFQHTEAANHLSACSSCYFAPEDFVQQHWQLVINSETNRLSLSAYPQFMLKRRKQWAVWHLQRVHPFPGSKLLLDRCGLQPTHALGNRFGEHHRWHPDLIIHRTEHVQAVNTGEGNQRGGVSSADRHDALIGSGREQCQSLSLKNQGLSYYPII